MKESKEAYSDLDFSFGFNNIRFSNKLLRIEIISDFPESKPDCDWASNRKRRREEIKEDNSVDVENTDSSLSIDCFPVLRVENIYINAVVLSSASRFFKELFLNDEWTLQIHASEEVAFMDLIYYFYHRTLNTSTLKGILDVLMVADKLGVPSCMSYCSQLLQKFPMTIESALIYLDLPSNVLMAESVRPLIDAARKFLALQFKDITKFEEEVMSLPLAGIEAVLSSTELDLASKDQVCDLALKWARKHHQPKLKEEEEKRAVVTPRLYSLLRSPYMTFNKLKEVLMICVDLDHKLALELVILALVFKSQPRYFQRAALVAAANEAHPFIKPHCIERAYRPVKVIEFEDPCKQCIVYWSLKKEECEELLVSSSQGVYTEAFHVGGQRFFLYAQCNVDHFGLFLSLQEGSMGSRVAYEVAFRQKTGLDFVSLYSGNDQFTAGDKPPRFGNLFSMPWTSFMAEDSQLFINGVSHLRVQLTFTH